MEEAGERLELVGVEVVDLVDAEDERLVADLRQVGQREEDLLDGLIVRQGGRLLPLDLQPQPRRRVRVDLLAREPGQGRQRQPLVGGLGRLPRVRVLEELEEHVIDVARARHPGEGRAIGGRRLVHADLVSPALPSLERMPDGLAGRAGTAAILSSGSRPPSDSRLTTHLSR